MPGPEPGLRQKIESHVNSIREGLAKQDHASVISGLGGLQLLSQRELIPPDHPLMDQSVLETLTDLLGDKQYGENSGTVLRSIISPIGVGRVVLTEDHPFMRFVFPKLVSPGEADNPNKAFMLAFLSEYLPERIGPDHPFLGPDLSRALASYEAKGEELSEATRRHLDFIVKKFSKVVPVEKVTEFLASENPGEKRLGRKILEHLCAMQHTFSPEKALAVLTEAAEKPRLFDRETKDFFAEKIGELLENEAISAVQFEQNPALLELHSEWKGLPPETKTMEEFASEVELSLLAKDFDSALFSLLQAKKVLPDTGFYDVFSKLSDPEKGRLYYALAGHVFPRFDTEHFEIPIKSLMGKGGGFFESQKVRDELGERLRVSEFSPSKGLPDSFTTGPILSEKISKKFKKNPEYFVGKPIGIAKKGETWMVLYLKEIKPDGNAKILGLCSPGIPSGGEGFAREGGGETSVDLPTPSAILYKLDKLAEMGAEKELVEDHIDGHVNTYLRAFDALSRLLRGKKRRVS